MDGTVMVKRPPTGTIPELPGSYQFKDAHGRVIYVGKASSLRQRLSNYFQDPRNLHPRTAQMVATAESVEWIEVRNEVEALMLEYSLIKQHQPAVQRPAARRQELPVPGRDRRRGVAAGAGDARPQAQGHPLLRAVRPRLRDPRHARPAAAQLPDPHVQPGKFNQHERLGRPCLLFHIEKCSGPCVGEIDEMPYRQLVDELCDFLDGDTDDIVKRLETEMHDGGRRARVRAGGPPARPAASRCARRSRSSRWSADRSEDIDVIGIADDELEAAVQVFYVRKGRVRRPQGLHPRQGRGPHARRPDRPHPRGDVRRRAARSACPSRCSCPCEPDDLGTYEEWLTHAARARGCRSGCRSAATSATLLETVTRNAKEEFTRHRLRRAGDHNTRSRALTELQDHLGLPEAPLRIECYDMAHLQGTDYVGSMVVLEDGLPNKREYRRFKVRDVPGNDDYAAMEEVLTPAPHGVPRRARPADQRARRQAGQVRLPAAAAARRRRQGPAQRRRAGASTSSG